MSSGSTIDLDQRVQRHQACAAFERGDFRTAFCVGDRLLRGRANDVSLRELVGLAASKIGRVADAEKHLRTSLGRKPRDPRLQLALAETLVQQGRLDEALARYDRVLRRNPDLLPALSGKAMILHRRGCNDDARRLLTAIVESGAEDAYAAAVFVTIEQSDGRFEQTVELLRRHLSSPAGDAAAERMLWNLLARAREAAGNYDAAFEAYAAKNAIDSRPFDRESFVREIDALIETFSTKNLEALPRSSNTCERPIFIASMPRSGSTLVEQILHAHPDAHGAGEITTLHEMIGSLSSRLESLQPYPSCLGDLTAASADELSHSYCESIAAHDPGAMRVVNKHLQNWRHLGAIALLFPGARVIHCRRDPMDNCFSLFMADLNTELSRWSSDLDHIGLVYRQYERIMTHWRSVLDLDVLDVPYEALVAEPDTWIRRIIEFCDLPWDERCLRFHEAKRDVMTLSYDQVRRPVYGTAAGRCRKYEAYLGPLERVLAS